MTRHQTGGDPIRHTCTAERLGARALVDAAYSAGTVPALRRAQDWCEPGRLSFWANERAYWDQVHSHLQGAIDACLLGLTA